MNRKNILKLQQANLFKNMTNLDISRSNVCLLLHSFCLMYLPGFFLGHPLLQYTNIHLILLQLIICPPSQVSYFLPIKLDLIKYINVEDSNDSSHFPYKKIITSKDHTCNITVTTSREWEQHGNDIQTGTQHPLNPGTINNFSWNN